MMIDPGALPTHMERDFEDEDDEEHDDTKSDLSSIGGSSAGSDSDSDSSALIVVEKPRSGASMAANRRKTRFTMTNKELKDSLRSTKYLVDEFTKVSNFEDSSEEMRKKWMEIYNDCIMKREEINKRKYSENDWRKLVLLQDVKGNLLLHHACRRRVSVETIRWLKGDDNDTVTLGHRSHDGSLPIHAACRAIAPFNLVKLIMQDSEGNEYLNSRDGDGHHPLELLGKGEREISGKNVDHNSIRLDDNPMFDSFAEDIFEFLIHDEKREQEEIFMSMDALCNTSPARKFQMIVCSNLRSQTNIEWLTWAFCQPNVIVYVMRDFYCQIAWIVLIFYGSHTYVQGNTNVYVVYALYIFALVFLIRELRQIRRYVRADVFIEYLKDPWNWLDCSTIFLVTSSAIVLQNLDPNNNPYEYYTRRLLMITGACQVAHFVSFLRKVFLPFATFVGGLGSVFKTLFPFLVTTGLLLLAFAFMYYVQNFNNPETFGELPYDTLWISFQSVLLMFLDAPESTKTLVDALFGLITTIILLNVVIAIVSEAWGRSTELEVTQRLFWGYRLAFVQDVTLSKNPHKVGKSARMMNHVSDRFNKSRMSRQERISDPLGIGLGRLKRMILHTIHFWQYIIYFVLGLFSFGLCWPAQIRKDIFAIKFREVKHLMKPEIYETRRVHKLVSTNIEEMEIKMKQQEDDNRFLMEQNLGLNEKIDRLESAMEKMSAILTQIDETLKSQNNNTSRMHRSGEVQALSNEDSSEEGQNNIASSRSLRMLASGEVQVLSSDDFVEKGAQDEQSAQEAQNVIQEEHEPGSRGSVMET